MRAQTLTTLIFVGIIYTSWQQELLSSDNDICRLFKNGVKLRKPGYCDREVICQDFKSTDGTTCTTANSPYYLLTNKCGALKSAGDYCKTACVKKSNPYTKDPKNCAGWYSCNAEVEIAHGHCEYGTVFDAAQQMCMYPSQTNCGDFFYKFCDVVPPLIPFQDEANCHKYYQCSAKAALEVKVCDTGLYFDVATATCIPKSQVNCYKHPYPEGVCGSEKLAIRGHFVADGATCRGYFYCRDLGSGVPDATPNWGQCAQGDYFDPKLEACIVRTHQKCGNDRCDGRTDGRELSETQGCQHYLECAYNSTISEQYCGDGLYFDVDAEDCTSDKKSYPACS